MAILPPLKLGNTIDIIAPAFGSSEAEVMQAVDFLQNWGLKARVAGDLLGKDLLCAHTDEARAAQLLDALHTPDTQAIWCLRGGYGCTRLLPWLQTMKTPPRPKWLMGFSDITLLHLWLNQRLGWPSLHAPTLLRAAKGEVEPASLALLKGWLLGTSKELRYALTPLNSAAKSTETITAPVLGGNLAVLTSALATPWWSSLSGKILLLEEVDERGYRIDRMLTQLQQAGAFAGVLAIVLGDFSGGEEKNGSSLVWPVLERFVAGIEMPVFRLAGVGHERVNNPLPLGIKATLTQNQLCVEAPR